MPGLSLTYSEFVNSIRMSKSPYIMLEGSQDRNFFDILRQTIQGAPAHGSKYSDNVAIATAEEVKSDLQIEGNRRKVEIVSKLVAQTSFRERFVGFVDREFRKFYVSTQITDALRTQRQLERLVWSRGHSIENYLLDFEVLRNPLFDSSENGQIAGIALQHLERNFPEILNVACALGLAGAEAGLLEIVRRTVHFGPVMPPEAPVLWNVGEWKKSLLDNSHLSSQDSDQLIEQFESCLRTCKASTPSDVRWACDGHLGIRFVWAAYAKYIYCASQAAPGIGPNAANQRNTVTSITANVRFNHLARSWATMTPYPTPNTPFICFELVKAGG